MWRPRGHVHVEERARPREKAAVREWAHAPPHALLHCTLLFQRALLLSASQRSKEEQGHACITWRGSELCVWSSRREQTESDSGMGIREASERTGLEVETGGEGRLSVWYG